jgi:hypothetical protein
VSRRHAEIRLSDEGWVIEDLGSSNGSFVGGKRIAGPRPLTLGDEIGFGKFSIVFGRALGEGEVPVQKPPPDAPPAPAPPQAGGTPGGDVGTMHISPHEVKELLQESDRKRRAHVLWESGGQSGTHYLADRPALLIGTDELCDVRVPKAPRHHVLVTRGPDGCEVRYLAMFGSMTVGGRTTRRTRLSDGDVVEAGGLRLTFQDEVA